MTTVYMLTSQSRFPMMSFIIKSDENLVVVDGGNTCDADFLCTYVRSLGGVIDGWFLTHPHKAHIDALFSMLERHSMDLKIGVVYYNFPSDDYIKREKNDSIMRVTRLRKQLADKSITVHQVRAGDVYKFGDIVMRVLREPDENLECVNLLDNSTVVYRLEADKKSMIFLGDLGEEGGKQLLENVQPKLLKADFVQMAHHGQRGVGRPVYDAIDPDYCFWCTPDWLWDNNNGSGYDTANFKTIVTRGWVSDIGIKKHYISKDGTHEVPLAEETD